MAYSKIQEQEEIINTYGYNMIVSASAGSGKTTVMLRKIIDILCNQNVKITEILALTYTNASAAEMRVKLCNQLIKNAQDNIMLLEELENINSADICTFDSFCQKLIKKYFYVLNIDPSFFVLEQSTQDELQRKALKLALDKFKQTQPLNYAVLLNNYGDNRTDKNIGNLVGKIAKNLTSIHSYENFKQTAMQLFEHKENCVAIIAEYKSMQNQLNYVKKGLLKLQTQASKNNLEKTNKKIYELLCNVEQLLLQKSLPDLVEMAIKMPSVKLSGLDDAPEITNILKKLNQFYKDIIISNCKDMGGKNNILDSVEACKNIVTMLLDIYEIYKHEYQVLKKHKNGLDFEDIERLTISLLLNDTVQSEIQNAYKYIFIDEFQDANAIQKQIIDLIKQPNNAFYVGDLKQAIYGFRNSNPKIFDLTVNQFSKSEISLAKNLNCNFRSCANVLNFVNNVFSVLMTQNNAGVDYANTAMLVPKAEYNKETCASVELHIIVKNKPEQEFEFKTYSVKNHIYQNKTPSAAVCEARLVASKIIETMTHKIYDAVEQSYRDVNFGDITVLLKKRGEYLTEFNLELMRHNIPTTSNMGADLEETIDAKIFINFIKLSINFCDDIALAAVMLSPLFSFSQNEMAEIRLNSNSKFFYQAVNEYLAKNDELANKIINFKNIIQNFYHSTWHNGVGYALSYVVKTSNYLHKLKSFPNFQTRQHNVKMFINSFYNTEFNYDIILYKNTILKGTRKIKASQASGTDTVNITTMHASKGLEYPIIFLCNLGDSLAKKPFDAEIEMSEELGIATKYYNQIQRKKYASVFENYIIRNKKNQERAEQIRLLYVAMTRAKNRLYLVGTTSALDFNKINDEIDLNASGTYLSQIVGTLKHNEIDKINAQVKTFNMCKNKDYVYNMMLDEELKEIDNLKPVNINKKPVSQDSVNKIVHYIREPYFNHEATKIAQKNSVSSILQNTEGYISENFAPQNLILSEHLKEGISKNELGSLYHKILELCNFNNNTKDEISAAIEKIKNKNNFDISLFNHIDKLLLIKNLAILKNLVKDNAVLKEQKFMMYVPYCEICNSDSNVKVLVQGVCDLVIMGNETIIVDYKFSSLNSAYLVEKYKKQLMLYKKAIEQAINKCINKLYILSIKSAELIEL